ncbi:MAG: AAA family ATPase [Chloroflexota bacterium]
MPDQKQIDALRAALAVSPENLPLRLLLAETLRAANLPRQAVVEFQAALQHKADLDVAQAAGVHSALGELLYELQQLPEALTHLKTAVGLDRHNAHTFLVLSRVEERLGKSSDALAHFGMACALDPAIADDAPPSSAEQSPVRLAENGPDDRARPANGAEVVSAERPKIGFQDVGGLETIKEKIRLTIIYPFQRPDLYAAYGKKAGGGILMYGPPGCGKTLLARATAGEVRADFVYVGIEDVLDMYHGESERKLHAIFQNARRKAPCVLFFDEIEAIGGKRVDMRQAFLRTLTNQFLAELDGFEGDNDSLLVIGATNSPWHIDSAIMRPGRFDRIVFVPPPDYEARLAILKIHLAGRPVANPDLPALARQTDGFSGADLMSIVESATEAALQDALRTGEIRPLTNADLRKALAAARPTVVEWLETARNYGNYANESGFYDDVMDYLKNDKRRR